MGVLVFNLSTNKLLCLDSITLALLRVHMKEINDYVGRASRMQIIHLHIPRATCCHAANYGTLFICFADAHTKGNLTSQTALHMDHLDPTKRHLFNLHPFSCTLPLSESLHRCTPEALLGELSSSVP